MAQRDLIDILLDENCLDTVYLTNEKGKKVAFEQIALIPFDNKMYSIMAEKAAYERGDEDCGLVFHIDGKQGKVEQVNNVNIISTIFEIYDRMFDELEGE